MAIASILYSIVPGIINFQCCDVRIADCLWQDMAIASICHVMVTVCQSEGYIRVSDSRWCSDSRPLIVGHGDCLYDIHHPYTIIV